MNSKQILEKYRHERTPVEKYSRVMGYFRPVHTWNIGKQQEHVDRKLFEEPK